MRFVSLAAAALLVPIFVFATPRPITDAEKAACEAVADHLARGPIAIVERLSGDSPFALLNKAAALEEIEARMGPTADARWELRTSEESFAQHGAVFRVIFASGIDDIITIDLTQVGGAWKIRNLRGLAELPDHAPPAKSSRIPFAVYVGAAAPLALAAARKRGSRVAIPLIAVSAVVLAAAGTYWFLHRHPATPEPNIARLAPLVALREAAAQGTPLPIVGNLTGEPRDVALLWKSQKELSHRSAEEIEGQLFDVMLLTKAPLLSLLRARIAVREGRDTEALKQYAILHQVSPAHDGFWFDEVVLTPKEELKRVLQRPDEIGSRDANVYYMLSLQHMLDVKAHEALEAFREGWAAQPVSRAQFISAGLFGVLLRDPAIVSMVNMNTPEEPRSADPLLGSNPMRPPPGAHVITSGRFLRITIGSGRLDIPGGAPLAPPKTPVASGRDIDDQEAREALDRVRRLTAPDLSSPVVQRMVEEGVDALEKRNRWTDVIKLTEGITPDSENISTNLIASRVNALLKLGRFTEARTLAVSPSVKNATRRNRQAAALISIAEVLSRAGAFDEAIATYKEVQSLKNAPDVTARIERVEIRRTLANAPEIAHTLHFEIHGTSDVTPQVAQRIGELLEAELQRLTRRLNVAQFRTVRVNVLPYEYFRSRLTRSDHVLGLYDGEITVPLGRVSRFREEVVSILTHELTHAVVAQASNDNAPRWFQEGIAQRMELLPKQENIFRLHPNEEFVALAVLDAAMENMVNADVVREAYIAAETMMRFLENRYGAGALNKLIASFRGGADTDEALRTVTGKSMIEVDREFREWGLSHQTEFVDNTPWPYERFATAVSIDRRFAPNGFYNIPR